VAEEPSAAAKRASQLNESELLRQNDDGDSYVSSSCHIISYHIIYLLKNKTNCNFFCKYSVQCMSETDKAPNEHLLSPRNNKRA